MKTSCEKPGNIMKLDSLIKDIKIEVPCKFEMLSFNRALVIDYYIIICVSFCTDCMSRRVPLTIFCHLTLTNNNLRILSVKRKIEADSKSIVRQHQFLVPKYFKH